MNNKYINKIDFEKLKKAKTTLKKMKNKDTHTYKLLRSGLEDIATTDDNNSFLKVLVNMDMVKELDYDNKTDRASLNAITSIYPVDKKCWYADENDHAGFNCLCGWGSHGHRLRIIGIVKYNDKYWVLGSTCIDNLKIMLAEKKAEPNLIEKIDRWIANIKKIDKDKNKAPCLSCGKKSITKTDFKDLRLKRWCKACIVDKKEYVLGLKQKKIVKYAPCSECNTLFKCPGGWLDYKGLVKTKCLSCWKLEKYGKPDTRSYLKP